MLREIELTPTLVNTQLIKLKEILDVTSMGYLSFTLIPLVKLNDLLKEIASKLPVRLSLIINTELINVCLLPDF